MCLYQSIMRDENVKHHPSVHEIVNETPEILNHGQLNIVFPQNNLRWTFAPSK